MIRLSFIVPFYNVEPYIEQCIRSLYDQDIPQSEYEVICVDDCSPDGSRTIVMRLQSEYPTLRLLTHAKNKRQGGARNTGLREAQGKYIWFIDSDDYIKPNCLKYLLDLMDAANLDLLKFYFDGRAESLETERISTSGVVDGTQLIYEVQTNIPLLERCCSACQQIIRRELLDSHSIKFVEGVQFEDDDFAYKLYAYAARTRLIDDMPYIVRLNQTSTTRRHNDYRRVRDIYAQALRMANLDMILAQRDARWHLMITCCIEDCINNCVFRMLKGLTIRERVLFWIIDRKQIWKLKPYLSRKSFAKLCFYTIWKISQK